MNDDDFSGTVDIRYYPPAITDKDIIDFLKTFNNISITDLENILEYLEDSNCLSEKGKEFKSKLWRMFIKIGDD